MNKEFYDKYINISEEEMIKGNIYGECRRMDKEDVYEWVYQDELKIKKQKEVIDRTINAIDLVIELIKQQPTEDDRWILDRLNGFNIILEDKEVSE